MLMECPTCHGELPSRECPECMEKTPAFGRFCCWCGGKLPERPPEDLDTGPDDFSDRILCSDGSCIGVINKDGVCSECGKPHVENGETE